MVLSLALFWGPGGLVEGKLKPHARTPFLNTSNGTALIQKEIPSLALSFQNVSV